jgi:DNA-binding PadR family transcriptional regulator
MPEIDRIPEGLLLAAVKRAQLHQDRDEGVAIWQIKAHLGLRHNGWTTRQVRPLLDALVTAGLLEHRWEHSRNLWAITPKGRRRTSAFSELPESPQHRAWHEACVLAEQEIERIRAGLREALEQATELLDEPGPTSGAWLALGDRLEHACSVLGSATYCLHEWAEPDDRRADTKPPRVDLRNTGRWSQRLD